MPHKIAPPSSLYQQALAREEQRHKGRLTNLQLARAKLALLDEYAEGLKAVGAQLHADEIELQRDVVGKNGRPGHVLRIGYFELGGGHPMGNKARAFLLSKGFTEDICHRYDTWATVTLSKGHLHVKFHVSTGVLPAPSATTATTA